jgi:hypothetical protein
MDFLGKLKNGKNLISSVISNKFSLFFFLWKIIANLWTSPNWKKSPVLNCQMSKFGSSTLASSNNSKDTSLHLFSYLLCDQIWLNLYTG